MENKMGTTRYNDIIQKEAIKWEETDEELRDNRHRQRSLVPDDTQSEKFVFH
jgi:hypothetical protein